MISHASTNSNQSQKGNASNFGWKPKPGDSFFKPNLIQQKLNIGSVGSDFGGFNDFSPANNLAKNQNLGGNKPIQKKCEECENEEENKSGGKEIQMKVSENSTVQFARCDNTVSPQSRSIVSNGGCDTSTSFPSNPDLNVSFVIDMSQVIPADQSAVGHFINNWYIRGGNEDIKINGFASCDGKTLHNWGLSCRRAQALKRELIRPNSSNARYGGIPPRFIKEVYANGETDQFSSSLPLNRRATATVMAGSQPPICPGSCPIPPKPPGPVPPGPQPPSECQELKKKLWELKMKFNECGSDNDCITENQENLTQTREEYIAKC